MFKIVIRIVIGIGIFLGFLEFLFFSFYFLNNFMDTISPTKNQYPNYILYKNEMTSKCLAINFDFQQNLPEKLSEVLKKNKWKKYHSEYDIKPNPDFFIDVWLQLNDTNNVIWVINYILNKNSVLYTDTVKNKSEEEAIETVVFFTEMDESQSIPFLTVNTKKTFAL
jgi:hypothetical protein